MSEVLKVDEINDIMTEFLDNLVNVAKIHTEFKEALGEEHEYTKLANSLVRIFNQYQSLYVYIKDQESYAKELCKVSKVALEVLSIKPYEMLDGNIFQKKKQIKMDKPIREEKIKELNTLLLNINSIIDKDIPSKENE